MIDYTVHSKWGIWQANLVTRLNGMRGEDKIASLAGKSYELLFRENQWLSRGLWKKKNTCEISIFETRYFLTSSTLPDPISPHSSLHKQTGLRACQVNKQTKSACKESLSCLHFLDKEWDTVTKRRPSMTRGQSISHHGYFKMKD